MTSEAQQAALEKPVVPIAYFVEFDFKGGTTRLSTLNQTVVWGGYEWVGVGAISNISAVNESEAIESSALNFTLNAAEMSWLSLAVGSVEEYRGRSAKMWMCPLDDSFQLVDDPVICWRGVMDAVSVGIEGEQGNITLKCETSAYGLKRKQGLRMSAAQQRKRHPTDTGLDYLVDLIINGQLWLSKKFQMQ